MRIVIQVELRPEVEARLATEAVARGLKLEIYVEGLLSANRSNERARLSPAEAAAAIRRLRKGVRLDGIPVAELVAEGRKY